MSRIAWLIGMDITGYLRYELVELREVQTKKRAVK